MRVSGSRSRQSATLGSARFINFGVVVVVVVAIPSGRFTISQIRGKLPFVTIPSHSLRSRACPLEKHGRVPRLPLSNHPLSAPTNNVTHFRNCNRPIRFAAVCLRLRSSLSLSLSLGRSLENQYSPLQHRTRLPPPPLVAANKVIRVAPRSLGAGAA